MRHPIDPKIDCVFKALLGAEANRARRQTFAAKPSRPTAMLKRGRYAARMAEGSNIVRIDRDLLGAFPDRVAVNEALRALPRIAFDPRPGQCPARIHADETKI